MIIFEKEKAMNRVEQLKSEFFSNYWVEGRHEYLQSLPNKQAQALVESLNYGEVDYNVNSRKFQESYICDYLEYLWEISPKAFWQHVKISLLHPDGIVISDNNFHIDKLERGNVPHDIWITVLESIILIPIIRSAFISPKTEAVFGIDISCSIIETQTMESKYKYRMRKSLINWVDNFQPNYQKHFKETWAEVQEIYQIGPESMPNIDKSYILNRLSFVYKDGYPEWLKKGLHL